jgi:hypothetical protein
MAQQPSDPELKPHKYFHVYERRKTWIRVRERDQFVFCRLYKFKCRMHTIDAMSTGTVVPVQWKYEGHTDGSKALRLIFVLDLSQVMRNQ